VYHYHESKEIDRAIAAAMKNGHIAQPDAKHLDVVPARHDHSRRYFLLDMAAIHGRTMTLAESSAADLVMVPGYGPFHGLPATGLRSAAEAKSASLKSDWATAGVYEADLAWLAERGFAVVNS
jgi:hypothetical protein